MIDKSLEKYKTACQQYVYWQTQIKQLSKQIGSYISDCFWDQHRKGVEETVNHLKEAYALGVYNPESNSMTYPNGTPEEYLKATCNHCYEAHLLVQKRKDARKQFGIAKRRITMLGKSLNT